MLLGLRYEARRRRLLRRAPTGPVRTQLEAPWPSLKGAMSSTPLLALDLETSGLNPRRDDIVSMGWVLLDDNRLQFASARHFLVRPRSKLPAQSVVIHGIGDDRAKAGIPVKEALSLLLKDLKGRVLVGHHIGMDARFLATACRGAKWGEFSTPCVDTLLLLERTARRRQQALLPGSLSLSAARRARGLPAYPLHDALWDAIAAAELWLSLHAERSKNGAVVRLNSVVTVQP